MSIDLKRVEGELPKRLMEEFKKAAPGKNPRDYTFYKGDLNGDKREDFVAIPQSANRVALEQTYVSAEKDTYAFFQLSSPAGKKKSSEEFISSFKIHAQNFQATNFLNGLSIRLGEDCEFTKFRKHEEPVTVKGVYTAFNIRLDFITRLREEFLPVSLYVTCEDRAKSERNEIAYINSDGSN